LLINRCLVGYEGGKGNVLVSLGKGDGGIEELKAHLNEKINAYGLVRKTEKIDDSVTVKFAFINWTGTEKARVSVNLILGENIDRMHRARIGTHTGAISSLFTVKVVSSAWLIFSLTMLISKFHN
jgi:hypothetical protein